MKTIYGRAVLTLGALLLPFYAQGSEPSKSVVFAVRGAASGGAPNRQAEPLAPQIADLRRKISDRAEQIGAAIISSDMKVNQDAAMKPYDFSPASSYGANPLDGTSAGFGFDDLYRKGAKVGYVYAPFDSGYRVISMKLYTIKNAAELQTMIGIVDITPDDPETPYAPKFIPITQSGEVDFQLHAGGRKYALRITMNQTEHNVLLSRQGARDGTGAALATSIEELSRLRADQASEGNLVTIGGAQFYTAPQGGVHGSILFFPKEYVDSRADVLDTRYLRPVAMGDISRLDNDGATVRIEGRPDIGLVNGLPYHLEFNGASWEVVAGAGDR